MVSAEARARIVTVLQLFPASSAVGLGGCSIIKKRKRLICNTEVARCISRIMFHASILWGENLGWRGRIKFAAEVHFTLFLPEFPVVAVVELNPHWREQLEDMPPPPGVFLEKKTRDFEHFLESFLKWCVLPEVPPEPVWLVDLADDEGVQDEYCDVRNCLWEIYFVCHVHWLFSVR